MPNWCNFAIIAKGSAEGLAEFSKVMENSASNKMDTQKTFLARVYEATCIDTTENTATYSGMCAWSVSTCMMDTPDSYAVRWRNSDAEGEALPCVISLPELAEKLKLELEVFSNEMGMNFAEYYRITADGEVLEDRCVDLAPWPEDEEEQMDFDPTDGVEFETENCTVPYGVFTI